MGVVDRITRWRWLAPALAMAALALAPAARGAAVQARPADAVVESIGVNTHLGYTDTPYNDFAMVAQRLRELGIRYIRDGVSQDRPEVYERYRRLATDGIRLDAIAGDPLQRWNIGTIDQQLDLIERELGSTLASLEGPNEYDLQGDANWIPVLREYTQRLWEGAKARPGLSAVPVIGPSVVLREDMAALGDLTPWIDFGNTHTYLSGAMPETDSIWDGELGAAARNSGGKPVQVTETGYHNGLAGTFGHLPTSESATGYYLPRLFLENFRRGIVRSYAYELLDQRDDPAKTDIEAAFGLLRNDFSKKPAAVALERLIGLLSNRGAAFSPGTLSYSLDGAPSSARQLLLQKRDGIFYLVLWNAVSLWDPGLRIDLFPADLPIQLRLEEPIASAEVFEPNAAAAAVSRASDPSELDLSLTPGPTVIKLVPPGAGEPGPPAPEPETPQNPEPPVEPETPTEPETPAGPKLPSTPANPGPVGRDATPAGGPPAASTAPSAPSAAAPSPAAAPSAAPPGRVRAPVSGPVHRSHYRPRGKAGKRHKQRRHRGTRALRSHR